MGAAERFFDDLVDDAVFDQILGGQFERLGGRDRLVGGSPQYR